LIIYSYPNESGNMNMKMIWFGRWVNYLLILSCQFANSNMMLTIFIMRIRISFRSINININININRDRNRNKKEEILDWDWNWDWIVKEEEIENFDKFIRWQEKGSEILFEFLISDKEMRATIGFQIFWLTNHCWNEILWYNSISRLRVSRLNDQNFGMVSWNQWVIWESWKGWTQTRSDTIR
jgi:hypothetical protein